MKYSTGALKNPEDNRDIKYTDLPTKGIAGIQLPTKHITDTKMLPILNQGQLGTCVAHAISYVKMYQEYKETGRVVNFSRRFLYSIARTYYYPYDQNTEGIYPRDGGKALKDMGILEPDTIDDNTLPHLIYSKLLPSAKMLEDSKKWSSGFATLNQNNISSIKEAIINEGIITVSLAYDGSKWNARTGKLSKPESINGSHYIAVYGYEEIEGGDTTFYFLNSWGDKWGDAGKGQFNYSDYRDFMYDIFVFTDIPNDLIEKAKNTQFIFTKNLKYGMTNNDVSKLQERLTKEGFYTYPQITGYFGKITKDAVIAYQKANSISPAIGNVGVLTRAKLNEDPKKKSPLANKVSNSLKALNPYTMETLKQKLLSLCSTLLDMLR